jgi:hypothetical protein
MEQLKAACRECSEKKGIIDLFSPDTTAPIAGMAFRVMAIFAWDVQGSGVRVGLYSTPIGYPSSSTNTLYMQSYKLTCQGICRTTSSGPTWLGKSRGYPDFFGIGVMSGGGAGGGLDEAAWAAKGLPTEGELEVQLEIQEVS